jgi:NAD(P)-dependent dehydrogenase (short-subunit alcohol dehydrogenase family)
MAANHFSVSRERGAAVPQRLAGKVAFITGATSGIGRACALRFAEEGAAIAAGGIDPPAGENLVREIAAKGGQAVYVNANIADPEEIRRSVSSIYDTLGRVHVFVSNAGIGTVHIGGTVESIEETQWEKAFAVNFAPAYRFCKLLVPGMRELGGGSIVLMSSYSALRSHMHRPSHAYVSTKGALLSLTRALAVSYAPSNIRCNALCPYLIATEMNRDLLDPARAAEQQEHIPLRRAGRPEEVANAALFLASDESSFITGHALMLDGGLDAAIQI